ARVSYSGPSHRSESIQASHASMSLCTRRFSSSMDELKLASEVSSGVLDQALVAGATPLTSAVCQRLDVRPVYQHIDQPHRLCHGRSAARLECLHRVAGVDHNVHSRAPELM